MILPKSEKLSDVPWIGAQVGLISRFAGIKKHLKNQDA